MLHDTYTGVLICDSTLWRKNPSPPPPSSSTRGGFGFFRCLEWGKGKAEALAIVLWARSPASLARERKEKGRTDVLSDETRIGKRVRVRADHHTANWSGQKGTIAKSWGDPTYSALDVLLDDGRLELFWHYELEEIAERA